MKKIILASASPRRSELLSMLGLEFEVVPSGCGEHIGACEPARYAEELSRRKCIDVAEKFMGSDCVVVGSDTIVVCGGKILGKPKDAAEAKDMLLLLSGNVHSVFTGVTIFDTKTETSKTFSEETRVRMYELTPAEIGAYIATGEPMDKAGAYGIQGKGAVLIESIEGDFYNVMGLPVSRLVRELRRFYA